MTEEKFNEILQTIFQKSETTLSYKAGEYAEDCDRLHNFRVAAQLQNISPMEALGGMMAKHLVSVYDLIQNNHGEWHNMRLWEEKLGDSINYLCLLWALVIEENERQEQNQKELEESKKKEDYFASLAYMMKQAQQQAKGGKKDVDESFF